MLGKVVLFFCAASTTLAIPFPDVKGAAKAEVDVCSLPPVNPSPISCLAAIPRWTYNAEKKACEKYLYGGCLGTENLFTTKVACMARCDKEGLQRTVKEADPKSPCVQPKASGTCRAFIPSFYFDVTTGQCTAFTYTGCGGNSNNFDSQHECESKCGDLGEVTQPEADQVAKAERCSLPPVKTEGGFSCLAFIPSWTFNSTSGQCESYVYGGCGRTANLYDNEEACNTACGPEQRVLKSREETCLLPVAKGPCSAFMARYAFVKEKNRCEVFTYGGCRGNKNNFPSADECYKSCGGDLPSTSPECTDVSCPVSNNRLIERGCRPEYRKNACCPSKFICPEEKSDEGVCRYRGDVYNIDQEIPQLNEDDACKTDCTCVASDKHRGGAKIKCNRILCDFIEPPHAGCVLVTKPGQCCGSYSCPEKRPDNEGPRSDVCVFGDKEYVTGQSIPTGEPCKRCNCVEGFTGLDGPGCREVHCVVDNRIGCVPVYVAGVCCPISYKCLSDAELDLNKTRVIRVEPKPGKQGVTTLPISISERDLDEVKVKPDSCSLPKEVGICRMSMPSFFYDSERNDCFPFIYGGCHGNANRFSTISECQSTCRTIKTRIIRIEPEPGFQGVMTLPIKVSSDDAASTKTRARVIQVQPEPGKQGVSTLPFILDEASQKAARPEKCSQPKKTGPCRMIATFYFFDAKKEKCVAFNYGGCDGNENRFATIEECRQTCNEKPEPSVCDLPVQEGPCRAHKPSYYYNAATGTCDSFVYGGCRGNGNRFNSVDECQQTCVNNTLPRSVVARARISEPVEDKFARCKLPADVGFCRAVKERFFYDSADKQCKVFNYGGCMGNANNFVSKQECLSACSQDDAVVGGKARARARARTLPGEEIVEQPTSNTIDSQEPVCKFGNLTLKLGEQLADSEAPCDVCVCSTPPELTCTYQSCPAPPPIENAICQAEYTPGQCCPSYSCVSSNPPSINVSRARARARTLPGEEVVEQPTPNVVDSEEPVCKSGNLTFKLGEELLEYSENPCEVCFCSTPPELTCTYQSCPAPPPIEKAICQAEYTPGQCCPSYSCVSSNPPSINVCEDVVCDQEEHCEVQAQESTDGNWLPPIGVCIRDSTSIPL